MPVTLPGNDRPYRGFVSFAAALILAAALAGCGLAETDMQDAALPGNCRCAS